MVVVIKCEKCGKKVGCVGNGKYLFCEDCSSKFCETLVLREEYTAFCKECV